MRIRRLVAFVLGIAVVCNLGCESKNKGKIEGTKWRSEATRVNGYALPEGALSLEFRTDGSMSYTAGGNSFAGTYSLGMGDTVTIELEKAVAGKKIHAEKIKIAGDRLTMIDGDGTKMTFVKRK